MCKFLATQPTSKIIFRRLTESLYVLTMTDTDTNAVSYRIVSSVLGSYHQGDSRFGATAGVQFASNSRFALCCSVIRNVCQ